MPPTHVVPVVNDPPTYFVSKNGIQEPVRILSRRAGEVYVHYVNLDKRMDEWLPENKLQSNPNSDSMADATAGNPSISSGSTSRKRKRSSRSFDPAQIQTQNVSASNEDERMSLSRSPSPGRKREREDSSGSTTKIYETNANSSMNGNANYTRTGSEVASVTVMGGKGNGVGVEEIVMTEEEFDLQHHKQITAQRNFDKVNFGPWQIKTWYFSPYPLTESEADDPNPTDTPTPNSNIISSNTPSSISTAPKIPGVHRTTIRSHGRTSDLLAGGLQRSHMSIEKSLLWVCDRCFKYMADGLSWELHARTCNWRHPPGRKVYQRGAHTIWEVDGAKDKLFCQNLSLFGKLFIDVKTLFFDCDNFLFYILTDADSQRDHVLAFFSKEKVSYDDYNLACIITLPPYQRRGYGMLLIEFSYELSRRAGKIGTPERPLSDLGLRSYLTYWVSTIIRFLRSLLSVIPPEKDTLVSTGSLPDLASAASPAVEDGNMRRKKKSTKGWDGEAVDDVMGSPYANMPYCEDPVFNSMRTIVMKSNPDGSASAHVYVKCTLEDIARATNLRLDDAAFALNECGLLDKIKQEKVKSQGLQQQQQDGRVRGESVRESESEGSRDDVEDVIVVTREMVEEVAKERMVKRMMMDLRHVML